MAENILRELGGTASSHPLVHESIRDAKKKNLERQKQESLLQLAALLPECFTAAAPLLLCHLKRIFLDTQRSGKWPAL